MKKTILFIITAIVICSCEDPNGKDPAIEKQMSDMYGVNDTLQSIPEGHPVVMTNTGVFVGRDSVGVASFKGIPYAKAPVGELRWKEPQQPDTSSIIREAYYFGKTSLQSRDDMLLASYYKQGEDCLTLNIWTASTDTLSNKPVMVFFHGGTYAWDGPSSPAYECHNMVKNHPDVVMVTVTYRLGIWGFLDLTEVEGGEAYSSSCNLGLLDQIAALRWVHDNIKSFGGDPETVTIFGESAGAGCTTLLPLISESKGLFKRMIAESGSIGFTQDKEKGKELTQTILELTGAKNMDDLLRLSADDLLGLYPQIENTLNMPCRDGKILPADPYKAYADGVAKDIDLMTGTNADECTLWLRGVGSIDMAKLIMPFLYERVLYALDDEDRERVESYFDQQDKDDVWKVCDFLTEANFRCPSLSMADKHSTSGGNTYVYYFDYPSAIDYYGSCHAIELGYVFDNSHIKTLTGDSVSATLVKAIPEMWINFARTGNPSTSDIEVPQYDSKTRQTVRLGRTITIESDILGEQRQVMQPVVEKYGAYPQMPRTMNIPIVWKTLACILLLLSVIIAAIVYGIRKVIKKLRSLPTS